MELFVILGQRKQDYDGQYGLEALGVMTQYDADANGEWLDQELSEYRASGEFESVDIVRLNTSESQIRDVLFPKEKMMINADVVAPK